MVWMGIEKTILQYVAQNKMFTQIYQYTYI